MPVVCFRKTLPQFVDRKREEDRVSYGLDHANGQLDGGSAEDPPVFAELFGNGFVQFDLKSHNDPREVSKKNGANLANRLTVSCNYCASAKVFI